MLYTDKALDKAKRETNQILRDYEYHVNLADFHSKPYGDNIICNGN